MSWNGSATAPATTLIKQLEALLLDLHSNPYPYVPNPPQCQKRASVALIIRIRPTFPEKGNYNGAVFSSAEDSQAKLNAFFSQSWVQHGDPEVVFIKRAARKGDRWTSHIALPGGKRDPEDANDQITSVRETMEEIGLDLSTEHSLFVGNLPERVVTTSWGKVPLMVLCPFVYVLTRYDITPLQLQPAEVNSAHWVSLRALLAPSLRTFEYADVSDRLARVRGRVLRAGLRLLLGQMMFAAVRLIPSESLYCSSAPGFIPEHTKNILPPVLEVTTMNSLGARTPSSSHDRPLLLWGLTQGIIADFLDLLPSDNFSKRWSWPTFSPWDVRFVIWLVTYRLHKQRLRELESSGDDAITVIEEGLDTLGVQKNLGDHDHAPTVDGSDTRPTGSGKSLARRSRSGAVGHMLEGHFELVRKAIVITLLLRFGVAGAVAAFFFRRSRRRS